MPGDDLWTSASEDHEHFAREAALARADAELEAVMPFLLASRTPGEFEHRASLAEDSLVAIAARNDLYLGDLMATARRRYEMYREALAEGTDPVTSLEPLLNGGGYGQGPERPDSHTEGPDFSGGYSEVPPGPPGGPDPQVTQVRPESPGPVTQAAGSLRRQADASPESMMAMPYTPPDLGTGNGSVDIGTGTPGGGGYAPSIPAGSAGGSVAPVGTPTSQPGVTSTASKDPVRSRVMRVTAMIAESNPGLPQAECERLGRVVVSRWLREGDLTDSVMSNGPAEGGGSGGSSGESGGGSGGMAKDLLAGQGLRSLLSGGAGEAAELAPLVAL